MNKPEQNSYDVVIIGGAMMGAAIAWFTAHNPAFHGRILVVERDPSYEFAATSRSNSCIRQQFSNEINIKISQFGVAYLKNFCDALGGDPDVPEITFQQFGYLYLAGSDAAARNLREICDLQQSLGARTRILSRDDLAQSFPFYHLDDIQLGSLGTSNEGYFDGNTMFDWWRRKARQVGVEFLHGEVCGIKRQGERITGIRLKSGDRISAGTVVNASGTGAAATARMAGLAVPVEPRKRVTYVFSAETPLPKMLPLTIDPSGVHVRSDGAQYLCGCPPMGQDVAVDQDDFSEEPGIFEEKIWPALAHRIPAFERIRPVNSWVGHYAYNTLDQNAIIGPHDSVKNFLFANGFSGHGFQQAAAVGRGISELLCFGAYQTLDLSALGYERITAGKPLRERNVI